MKNTLFISSAGSGKTTLLIKEALSCSENVLITTFTEENEMEIKRKILELNIGIFPSHITVQTWFSFLIEHGAKPYQGKLINKRINGLLLVNERSGLKYKRKYPIYYSEEEVGKHYFTSDYRIYSDKLSKFVVRCNEKSNGYVIDRLTSIFKNIYIDEVQDLAGYDLEIIKLLLLCDINIKLAGDPRQVTYHTHFPSKYVKYSNGNIKEFILNECKKIECFVDDSTLSGSWRNNKMICEFSNRLFTNFTPSVSHKDIRTGHDGIFLIDKKDVDFYLNKYSPLQLRFNRLTKVNPKFEVKNFGEAKGISCDRVLIYPTKKILNWLKKGEELDNFEIRCKFYVAVTRARYSVAIVC